MFAHRQRILIAMAIALDPRTASIIFAAFLVLLIVRLVFEAVKLGRTE